MNKEIESQIGVINSALLNDDIKFFKIGKTDNPKERFAGEDYDDYSLASVIAYSDDALEIDQAEKDLIDYYLKHPILKKKCRNEQLGGGNSHARFLYIIASYNIRNIYDALLQKKPLISDFKIIEL